MEESDTTLTEELDAIYAAVDEDGDGCISLDEFHNFWTSTVKGCPAAQQSTKQHRPLTKQPSIIPDFSNLTTSPRPLLLTLERANSRKAS